MFACSAAQHAAAALAGLAEGCPPRDALPLFLEALQVSRESAGERDAAAQAPHAWRLHAALLRGAATLLQRMPRRRWEAALSAAPQALAVARDAAAAVADAADAAADAPHDTAEQEEAAAAAAALDAAVAFGDAAAAAADAAAAPAAAAAALPRLLLRLLGAAAPRLPCGGAHAALAPLRRLLHARGVCTWAALARACAPADACDGSASDSDDDNDALLCRSKARDSEARHVALGAALLAHAWACGDDAEAADARASITLAAAAPHAAALLSGAAGAAGALLGAQLAAAAAAASALPASDASSEPVRSLLTALAAAMAHSPSPDAREGSYCALLRCLDAHAPWCRLAALRHLISGCRDASVCALLWRRVKDDAARDWPHAPFGAAPAARMAADWLQQAARDSESEDADAFAESADALIGALAVVRYLLLRDVAAARDVSGLARGAALRALRERTLAPLRRAAAAAAAALGAESGGGAALAAQTLQEVCDRVEEAADAAGTCADADADADASASAAPPAKAPGLRRGFLS